MYHITKDGRKMLISEMSNSHLINTIKHQHRMASEGVTVSSGGGWPDDPWFDTETYTGQYALDQLDHEKYRQGLLKRVKEETIKLSEVIDLLI